MDEYSHFDADLVIYINAAFSTLNQLGVGPKTGFSITIEDDKDWSDYIADEIYVGIIQEYVILYTKLLFDPPQSASVTEMYNQKTKELEWRLNVAFDSSKEGGS